MEKFRRNRKLIVLINLIFLVSFSACIGENNHTLESTSTPFILLTPYISPAKDTVMNSLVLPQSSSLNPKTYIVKQGDTMSAIALKFGVTIDDILVMNPGIDSQIISTGSELKIPEVKGGKTILPKPTPLPLLLSSPLCNPVSDGGLVCIITAQNTSIVPLEGVSIAFLLYSKEGKLFSEKEVASPFSRILEGMSLPIAVYFPHPLPEDWIPVAIVRMALPGINDNQHYLTAEAKIDEIHKAESQKWALARGHITLTSSNHKPLLARLLVSAQDEKGNTVGMKTWEWEGVLSGDNPIPFEIEIFSISSTINTISVQSEIYLK